MQHDRRGLPLTTRSAEAAAALDDAVLSLVRHRGDMTGHLDRALAADPDMVAALALAGFARLLLARADLVVEARFFAEAGRRSLQSRGGTAREHSLVSALYAWCEGEMARCAALLETALEAAPVDLMTFKLAHAVRFMLGDAPGMRIAAERALPAWFPDAPERGFVLGCRAFALEETGDLAASESDAREALALDPDDLWASHALTHVLHAAGRTVEASRWLAHYEPRFGGSGPFGAHLYWHAALLHLARNERQAALELYDARVQPCAGADYRGFANAASLLCRLEHAGLTVDGRWEQLADLAADRVDDHALVFAQLHRMLALAGARRWEDAVRMLAAMDTHGREGWGTQARLLREIGIPLAKAIFGMSIGDAGRAADLFHSTRRDRCRIGGSRLQRSVFDLLPRAATWGAATCGAAPRFAASDAANTRAA